MDHNLVPGHNPRDTPRCQWATLRPACQGMASLLWAIPGSLGIRRCQVTCQATQCLVIRHLAIRCQATGHHRAACMGLCQATSMACLVTQDQECLVAVIMTEDMATQKGSVARKAVVVARRTTRTKAKRRLQTKRAPARPRRLRPALPQVVQLPLAVAAAARQNQPLQQNSSRPGAVCREATLVPTLHLLWRHLLALARHKWQACRGQLLLRPCRPCSKPPRLACSPALPGSLA